MLILIVFVMFVASNLNTDEVLLSCNCDVISMLVECSYKWLPLATPTRSKPSKIITMSNNNCRFTVESPLEEALEIRWGIMITSFSKTLVEFLWEVLTSRWEFTKFPTASLQNPSGQLYARVPVINTGKPGLALVIRYAPMRSPTRMTRRYTAAIVMHILMKHAETLPQQYTAKGLKSTRGIYRQSSLMSVSLLMLNIHFMGTRYCPAYGTKSRQALPSKFLSLVSIDNFHSGMAIAFENVMGEEVWGLDD
jgi:hypothetical protein